MTPDQPAPLVTSGTAALAASPTHDNAASQLQRDVETEYGPRDVDLPAVTQALRDSRDTLLVANHANPNALGDFGFNVDEIRAAAKSAAKTTA
jgi:hypothetical protein